MSFTIPNEADAAFTPQAEPDKVDIDILVAGLNGNGVVSGCAVTAQGSPDMTLAVAVGIIRNADRTTAAVTAGNVTVTTADATNPRIDLIVVSNAGSKSVTAGTPAASPVMPSIPANSVVLAALYVPAGDTAMNTNQITDKRVILPVAAPRTEAVLSGDVTMTVSETFVDGPTVTPAAGTYDVWARVAVKAGGAANNDFTARLIANASVIDETELDVATTNTFIYNLFLSARVVADGTNPILIRSASGVVGGSGYKMVRDPANNSSALHRATLLVLVKVA